MRSEEMLRYYSERAFEYENIYLKPERQEDLSRLATIVSDAVQGLNVLEVACGTGYWTERYAHAARSVLATDASNEVLGLARAKSFPSGNVDFASADAYRLMDADAVQDGFPFDAAVVAFWWSHIPRSEWQAFLTSLHACLAPGATVLVYDNRFVAGSSTPISETDADGNTFQRRVLGDGRSYSVLKNFPDPAVLQQAIAPYSASFQMTMLEYFWVAQYRRS